MRPINVNVLSAKDNQTTNGITLDASWLINMSFHAYFGDTQAGGTFKLQASNDPTTAGNLPSGSFSPTNWVDIPNAVAAISSGTSAILSISNNSYRWVRAVYVTTATGAQTVSPIADTGVLQSQTVTTVADSAGSLNSKWFSLSSINKTTKAEKDFYLWLDNGTGVDPAPPGKTGIHVTYTTNDTANTIATDIRTALNALTNDFTATGTGANVIITSVAPGPLPAATDGTAATGFTFGARTIGVVSNLNNTYFLLSDEASAHKFYVWNNVSSIGTDPAIAGRTGIEVDFAAGAAAATIGTAMATAVAAANSSNSFTTSGTSTVTITNKTAGPFVPATDGAVPTGFTFAVTGGGNSTVNINMFGLGA